MLNFKKTGNKHGTILKAKSKGVVYKISLGLDSETQQKIYHTIIEQDGEDGDGCWFYKKTDAKKYLNKLSKKSVHGVLSAPKTVKNNDMSNLDLTQKQAIERFGHKVLLTHSLEVTDSDMINEVKVFSSVNRIGDFADSVLQCERAHVRLIDRNNKYFVGGIGTMIEREYCAETLEWQLTNHYEQLLELSIQTNSDLGLSGLERGVSLKGVRS